MKINKEMTVFCPYCNKHTKHTVKNASKGAQRKFSFGTRRHERKIKGYTSSVAIRLKPKKLGKSSVLLLTCTVCKKAIEKVYAQRSKKKIEIKK